MDALVRNIRVGIRQLLEAADLHGIGAADSRSRYRGECYDFHFCQRTAHSATEGA